MTAGQLVTIAPRATSFTAVCGACARGRGTRSWTGATFAGRLDLDLSGGVFLCRNGHRIRVERATAPPSVRTDAA